MPTHTSVPWEILPHTVVKHEIYAHYLSRWFPILLTGQNAFRSVTYAEGFAGPGIYSAGEPGSPVHAIRTLLAAPEMQACSRPVSMVFVDDDPRCIRSLTKQLRETVDLDTDATGEEATALGTIPGRVGETTVSIALGKCGDRFIERLDAADAWGKPILAVLDTWGVPDFPYDLLKRIADNKAGEVIITFGPQHFIRFVGQKGPEVDEWFGHSPEWRAVADQPDGDAKRRHMLTTYRQAVSNAGFRYLLDFELIDVRGESLYLIFGTNSDRGLSVMKESLWSVDPNFGVRFRDPRDTMNEALFAIDDPQTAPLQRLLMDRLRDLHSKGRDTEYVEYLRRWTLFQTVYREPDVIPALTKLRAQNLLGVDPDTRIRRGSKVHLLAGAGARL